MKVLEDTVAVLGKKLKGVAEELKGAAEELKELKMAGECSDPHHSITLSLSHTHTHTDSLSPFLVLSLTHSLAHSLSDTHSHRAGLARAIGSQGPTCRPAFPPLPRATLGSPGP